MKNKYLAGLAFAMLVPVVGNAAPINWATEQYKIYADLKVNGNVAPTFNVTKTSLSDLPFSHLQTLSSTNGSASADIAIRNLSNSTANIYELTNKTTTNHIGDSQFAFADTSAEIINTFIANSTSLYVTYDYSSFINMSESTSKLSYQEVTAGLYWQNELFSPTVPFFNDYVDNSGSQSPHNATTAGINYSFIGNGTHIFSGLVIGNTYKIRAAIVPDMFSSGTISDNSSNSLLRVSFSDTAPVPEPETFAMLLAGLALIGFSAKRKKLA